MIKRTTTRIIRFMKYFHYKKDHNNSRNLLVYSQQVLFLNKYHISITHLCAISAKSAVAHKAY